MKEKHIVWVFIVLGLIIFSLFSWYLFNLSNSKNNSGKQQTSEQTTDSSPQIPASSEGAKKYIDQAMELSSQKKYDQALSILETALKEYPDDQNLRLDMEYIENLKRKDVQ